MIEEIIEKKKHKAHDHSLLLFSHRLGNQRLSGDDNRYLPHFDNRLA
jgi:hypothetical protein